MNLIQLAQACKNASTTINNATTTEKNKILQTIYQELDTHRDLILDANQKDLQIAKQNGMKEGLLDRMLLNNQRIDAILNGILQVISQSDPIASIQEMHTLENGLQLGCMRVPLGVVGMIYEARPNVSVDAAILCVKAGNAVMLRGSKDIIHSNKALVSLMQKALSKCQFPPEIISLVEDTSREVATAFMRLNSYLDVLIPRGGKSLIQSCVEHASVPILETGTGNCHIYIDKDANLQKATSIVINAKTSRTSVCNACESIIIHEDISDEYIQSLLQTLQDHNVIIHADSSICKLQPNILLANEEDYAKEYLDLEISIKKVKDVTQAIQHINTYSTHHSESIISENYSTIKKFLREVDSACVYANASTRFSDGFEFNLGAEIGISTQKLHARGPMGLEALTTNKYIILGDGQIR